MGWCDVLCPKHELLYFPIDWMSQGVLFLLYQSIELILFCQYCQLFSSEIQVEIQELTESVSISFMYKFDISEGNIISA